MGLRFRQSIRLAKGVRVNLGLRGASLSLGRPGATVNFGQRGTRATVGAPGTGLSYSTPIGGWLALAAVAFVVLLLAIG